MRKVTFIIGLILLLPTIYLIYVYNIHDGWNKTEKVIFALCLIVGLINSLILFYQKKRDNKNN